MLTDYAFERFMLRTLYVAEMGVSIFALVIEAQQQ